jgi:hypothetical protein
MEQLMTITEELVTIVVAMIMAFGGMYLILKAAAGM